MTMFARYVGNVRPKILLENGMPPHLLQGTKFGRIDRNLWTVPLYIKRYTFAIPSILMRSQYFIYYTELAPLGCPKSYLVFAVRP